VVGPRWDITADLVLPVLDDAMARWLRGKISFGEALHAACVEASRKRPRSVAWALSLEGDGR